MLPTQILLFPHTFLQMPYCANFIFCTIFQSRHIYFALPKELPMFKQIEKLTQFGKIWNKINILYICLEWLLKFVCVCYLGGFNTSAKKKSNKVESAIWKDFVCTQTHRAIIVWISILLLICFTRSNPFHHYARTVLRACLCECVFACVSAIVYVAQAMLVEIKATHSLTFCVV